MAGIFATAGASLSMGQVVASQTSDFIAADFDSQSWVDVSWLETIGAFGDEATEVTFDSIDTGRTQKLKGQRNAGNMEVACAVDVDDDGQFNLRSAETTDFDWAFRVTFDDAPSGGTPSYRYFIAKVMSAREELGTANNVVKLMVTLAINSNISRIAAAA